MCLKTVLRQDTVSRLNITAWHYNPKWACGMHHYGCVGLHFANILQKDRFWAASLASGSSMREEDRLSLMLNNQVVRGWSRGLLQFSACCMNITLLASAVSFEQYVQDLTVAFKNFTKYMHTLRNIVLLRCNNCVEHPGLQGSQTVDHQFN